MLRWIPKEKSWDHLNGTMLRVHLPDEVRQFNNQWAIDYRASKEALRGSRDDRNDDSGRGRVGQFAAGKHGEAGAALVAGGMPDYDIYATGSGFVAKWQPDLIAAPGFPLKGSLSNLQVYVKTCDLGAHGGDLDSWLIEIDDRICENPAEDDAIVLMYSNASGKAVFAYGWVYALDIKRRGLWGSAFRSDLKRRSKQALYRNDLEAAGDLVRRFEPDALAA